MRVSFKIPDLKVNRVIRFFITADLMLFGGWGLIGPVFALFIMDRIEGANFVVVGAATAVYWFAKSSLQIPIAVLLDRNKGEQDDFRVLITAFLIAGFSALSYLLIHTVSGLLLVALLQGIAFGLYVPAWSALFSRHLDREHYSLDWSLDSTALGFASGITALLGGLLVTAIGFNAVFIFAAVLSFSGAVLLISVPDLIFPKKTSKEGLIQDHTPSNIQR